MVTADRGRIAALRARERELFSVHATAWTTVPETCRWGRGFIDHGYDGDMAWDANVFDETPMIRSLGLVHQRLDEVALTALAPLVPRLVTLDLRGTGLTEVGALAAGASERLGLLDVRDNQLSPVACAQLAKAFPSALVLS